MFKFLILIYLFSVSSYSQPSEQQQIEQQEIEYEDHEDHDDHLNEEIGIGAGNPNEANITVESCGRNNIDDKSPEKIVGGRGMK
jgi:hypothetical protein